MPGRATELAGTAWFLMDDEAEPEQATALAFPNDRISAGGLDLEVLSD